MTPNKALLVIDVQNDFCPGGRLAVERGDEVVPVINRLSDCFQVSVLTQDWHPQNHASLVSNHPGAEPFSTINLNYGVQVLWPDHCVQGSEGAAFHPDLATDGADLILRKGNNSNIDSYSAFYENDRKTPTGLLGYLRERNIDELVLAGLATDFCVRYSAVDAARLGFKVRLVKDACRAIDLDGSLDAAMTEMNEHGVAFVDSSAII